MTYIGYNHEGKPISIVVAKSKELAYAYWQGKGILPISHKCVEEDFIKLEEHPTGVFPIMETIEKDDYDLYRLCNTPKGRKFLIVNK